MAIGMYTRTAGSRPAFAVTSRGAYGRAPHVSTFSTRLKILFSRTGSVQAGRSRDSRPWYYQGGDRGVAGLPCGRRANPRDRPWVSFARSDILSLVRPLSIICKPLNFKYLCVLTQTIDRKSHPESKIRTLRRGSRSSPGGAPRNCALRTWLRLIASWHARCNGISTSGGGAAGRTGGTR